MKRASRWVIVSVALAVCCLAGWGTLRGKVAGEIEAPPERKKKIDFFHWGLELWEMGEHEAAVRINEPSQVRIVRIEGYISAGPVPNAGGGGPDVVRQVLMSMPNHEDRGGTVKEVAIVGEPATKRHHQSVARNIFSLNIKQSGEQCFVIPVERDFPYPFYPKDNRLRMHFEIRSFRYREGSFESKDGRDALNTEFHFIVYYEV